MRLARLQEPSQTLISLSPVASPELCYDFCCQFVSGDGSQCNAAVFELTEATDATGGKCTLLSCRPNFGSCAWAWSPTTKSSVARIVRNNTEPAQQQLGIPVSLRSGTTKATTAEVSTDATQDASASSATTDITTVTQNSNEPVSTTATTAAASTTTSSDVGVTDCTDDSYYSDEFDYLNIAEEPLGSGRLREPTVTTQATTTTTTASTAAATDGVDDDNFWHLVAGEDQVGDDGHWNEGTPTTTLATTLATSLDLSTVSGRWVDTGDTDKTTNGDDVAAKFSADRNSQAEGQLYNIAESAVSAAGNADVEQWPWEDIKSYSSENQRMRTGEPPSTYDAIGNDGVSEWSDGDNEFKAMTILLPSAEERFYDGLQPSSVLIPTLLSVIGVVCLMLVIVGCRRACDGDRPRYVQLRDNSQSKQVDFPTNYLVAQSSTGYRAT
jgi:hypothetical protein